jgi:Zn-dependent protease with chaperone function
MMLFTAIRIVGVELAYSRKLETEADEIGQVAISCYCVLVL